MSFLMVLIRRAGLRCVFWESFQT